MIDDALIFYRSSGATHPIPKNRNTSRSHWNRGACGHFLERVLFDVCLEVLLVVLLGFLLEFLLGFLLGFLVVRAREPSVPGS